MTYQDKLMEYGIQTEYSDLRLHICVLAKRLYLYSTSDGIRAIESNLYEQRTVKTGNMITASGYLVPPHKIDNCKIMMLPDEIWERYPINEYDSTSKKGKQAESIATWALENGYVPLPLLVQKVDLNTQYKGIDIYIQPQKSRIQVKCDYKGGHKRFNDQCTGYLFLQTKESNPYKQY